MKHLDIVAFCRACGGMVACATADTPEEKQSALKSAQGWLNGGFDVRHIEHEVDEPAPRRCNC